MMVLFVCAHKPVGVQFVLPVHTVVGLPCLSRSTANLLCPMWSLLLNIRFCSRGPMSFCSFARTGWFVTSHVTGRPDPLGGDLLPAVHRIRSSRFWWVTRRFSASCG